MNKSRVIRKGSQYRRHREQRKTKKLLQAFQECQEGHCTCPTQEYSKLDAVEIATDEDTIKLKLKSKPDVKFDMSEIGNCLEHTKENAGRTLNHPTSNKGLQSDAAP